MAVSSLSRRQRVRALVCASAVALASWLYFANVWRGVVLSDAGDAQANGYYKWEPTENAYIKSAQTPAGAWRVPNVYDLVSRGPEFRKDAGPLYFLQANDKQQQQQQSRVWYVMRSGKPEYRSQDAVSALDNAPPSTGWEVGGTRTKAADLAPPPEVRVCGKRVPPDDDPTDPLRGKGSRRGGLALAEGPREVVNHPATVLLLAINLAFGYHLWAKRVSSDTVSISYALFWEEREYWRLFTASFAHFEPLHLMFNAMGTWNTRELERLLGSFRYLYLSLDLVVTTIMLLMLVKHALVKWRGLERQRLQPMVGFSCVLFAYMTYLAVAMREFCPMGESLSTLCFTTWGIPMFWGLPSLPVNLGPFASLALAQVIMPRAAFLGHLSGILMGYLMAWGLLGGISTPILAGASVIFMLQHANAWARKMPDFSLLLQSWAGGDVGRVARARRMSAAFAAHVCLTVAFSFLFTWGSAVGEVMALVVGFNALQALKCCCCPDSVHAEHRFCVNLLKAYGALSGILLLSDLASFGAILGQSCFVAWSGVSETSRECGLVLLVAAAAVHGLALAACVEGLVIFRDGQIFLSSIGLKQVVSAYSQNADAEMTSSSSSSNPTSTSSGSAATTPSYSSAAGITSGRLYRGGGRALGTAASNRPGAATSSSGGNANSARSAGGGGSGGSSSRGVTRLAGGGEAGVPLLGRGAGERGRGGASSPSEIDL